MTQPRTAAENEMCLGQDACLQAKAISAAARRQRLEERNAAAAAAVAAAANVAAAVAAMAADADADALPAMPFQPPAPPPSTLPRLAFVTGTPFDEGLELAEDEADSPQPQAHDG